MGNLRDMLTTDEAAAALRVAEWTMQRKCKQAQIPGAIKLWNKWLIPRETVEQLLLKGSA